MRPTYFVNAHIPRHLRGRFFCVLAVRLLIPKSLGPDLLPAKGLAGPPVTPAGRLGTTRQSAALQRSGGQPRLRGQLCSRPRRAVLYLSAAVRIEEKWGVFERALGPVTARKPRAEGSEQGVDNSVNMNLPTVLAQCARRM